uniref:Regulator of microtubule dynamics protein 2 n=2 Tax=Gasterosteus aculeatus aculeatus TaxID=481459 RepID=A0AAQ4QPE7_GASAC
MNACVSNRFDEGKKRQRPQTACHVRCKACRMAQADKVLVLGALAGVGIGLAVAFYQGFRSRRRGSGPWDYLNPANAQAAGVMMANGPGLPGGQAEVLQRLEALLQCVSELKDEMKSLKNALPTLQEHVREELRGRDEARRASPLHRTTPTRRKRAAGAIAAARAGARSSEEAESEGGYMTALTDSEEEEQSDAEEEDEDEEQQPANKLCVLLERIDRLHQGSDSDKRECLDLLLEQRAEFGQNSTFLWRLIRAYCDVHDISATLEEKKTTAETGKKVGEEVVGLDPACAESHQWYAIMCGIMADYETVQNKIKNGYIFKDHLDKAIELKPQDPMSYYLLGRWCYAVAQLSWIERKVAATLFGEPPSATVQDALSHFLKVEEIQPGYSKNNYVFLAKCYKDLGRREKARKMCEAASSMNTVTKEDEEAQKELELLCPALGV